MGLVLRWRVASRVMARTTPPALYRRTFGTGRSHGTPGTDACLPQCHPLWSQPCRYRNNFGTCHCGGSRPHRRHNLGTVSQEFLGGRLYRHFNLVEYNKDLVYPQHQNRRICNTPTAGQVSIGHRFMQPLMPLNWAKQPELRSNGPRVETRRFLHHSQMSAAAAATTTSYRLFPQNRECSVWRTFRPIRPALRLTLSTLPLSECTTLKYLY
jgi:hypothetical protein